MGVGRGYGLARHLALSSFGFTATTEAVVVSREVGVALAGLGIINWLARNAVGGPLRGLLWGNIVLQPVRAASPWH
jgi:hypothetical protein